MAVINAQIDDLVVKKFRHVLYNKYGLKKGDLGRGLEEAMLDYIQKYSKHGSGINRLAATAKTMAPSKEQQDDLTILYSELDRLGADIGKIKRLDPTTLQLKGLLEGLKKLHRAR